MRVAMILASVIAVAAGAGAAPSCAGTVEIVNAQVVRVERNAALILKDGRAAMLEGIRLPDAVHDHAPSAIADRAMAALKKLTEGKSFAFYAIWPKEDRYDRVRAQIFDKNGDWLQVALLRQGLARVALALDRGECDDELYAAEDEARRARLGLWALPAYAVRTPETVGADIGTFQIVVGRVKAVARKNGRAFLNFGDDWRNDFTVVISPEDMKTFRRMKVDPRRFEGRLIRVRGIVQSYNGPEIEIGNPKQIELLE